MIFKSILTLSQRHARPRLIFRSFKTSSKNEQKIQSPYGKYLGAFAVGTGMYFLGSYLIEKKKTKSKIDTDDDDTVLNLDLNEIYEKTAVVFLSNPELRDVMGMPIKITTSNEIDQVRSVNLRREATEVFSFIAYDLQGSKNSGIVYCKLKMEKETQKFKVESIVAKLSKPDSKNRTEIILTPPKKS